MRTDPTGDVRPRRRSLALVLFFVGLAVSGCGRGLILKTTSTAQEHQVQLRSYSTVLPTQITYRVNGTLHHSPTTTKLTKNNASVATVNLTVPAGAHVSMVAGPPAGPLTYTTTITPSSPANTVTCSIRVDGTVRATAANSALIYQSPRCETDGYVAKRPFQLGVLLELIALVVCVLIVGLAIGAQVMPERRRRGSV